MRSAPADSRPASGSSCYRLPACICEAWSCSDSYPSPRQNNTSRCRRQNHVLFFEWACCCDRIAPMKIVAAVCALLIAGPLFAQEWDRYQNLEDHFAVSAPGNPAIEKTKWKSEYGSMFPETVYRWDQGANRYTVTVVDYSDSEAIYMANQHSAAFQLSDYWQIDILGSIQYAATQYRQKPGVKVTFDAFHYINLVTGHELQLTNPDQSRTYVGLYLHENRLYIFDATVAKNMPPPLIFQQSPEFLDENGN